MGIERLKFQYCVAGFVTGIALLLAGCGGGGGGDSGSTSPPPAKVSIQSGVAQKGPLITNSTVTAQELSSVLAPTGKQYTFQIMDDLGRFDPSAVTFGSSIIGLNASGYYFDEVTNAISTGPISLQGVADLNTDTVMNVNLLSTLSYNRIKKLVDTGLSIAAARSQAEAEVLNAFYIYSNNAVVESFVSLDISRHHDSDNILAAISSLFVNGNTAGNLSALIASFQTDLADNGVIDGATLKAALATSASTLSPSSVAGNLSAKYIGIINTAYTTKDISDWIDRDGDLVIGRYEFTVPDSGSTTAYTLPPYAVTQLAGTNVSLSAGTLSINGSPVTGSVTVKASDVVTVSPAAGPFVAGAQVAYLSRNTTKIAKISFLSGLQSIAITGNASTSKGLTRQLTATATFTDSATQVLNGATWASNDTNIATVDASGTVTGVSQGTATITATFSGVVGSVSFSVTPPVLTSISVSNPVITLGGNQQLSATGLYSDATTADLTSAVSWLSLTPTVATVDTSGLATAVGNGTASITATSGAIIGNATITVTAATLVSIAVTPITPSVNVGSQQQFTATGTYSDTSTQTLSGVTWSSGTPSVASINGTGLVSTLTSGATVITAIYAGVSGNTTLNVSGLDNCVWDSTNWNACNWQ